MEEVLRYFPLWCSSCMYYAPNLASSAWHHSQVRLWWLSYLSIQNWSRFGALGISGALLWRKGALQNGHGYGSSVRSGAFFFLGRYLSVLSVWNDTRSYAGGLSPETMLDPGNAYTWGCVCGVRKDWQMACSPVWVTAGFLELGHLNVLVCGCWPLSPVLPPQQSPVWTSLTAATRTEDLALVHKSPGLRKHCMHTRFHIIAMT